MFTELGSLERLVNGAHELGIAVIMSSHDFEHTPPLEQIVARLTLQQDLGADIVKIAVMPEAPPTCSRCFRPPRSSPRSRPDPP
ncbi:hypothetical protein GCM10025867_42530 [Frondihabitans sucicola]|uniref:3-dehydroquinate dehydratase n=1 Tax=Frondihabitans sucicola TaxID=1268041 RepID=A0ABN6Y3W2_9MICO|nr:hypothetical protein GCM10025867_42530 [Frondihabitans sucicola]